MVSGVHCGVPILERSFSAEPLQLSIVCCTVARWCSSYLSGYQHCPRSLTRLAYLPCPCPHLQLTHPALPVLLPNRVSYLMIVTYLPRISALLSQTPQAQLTTFCLVIIRQTTKSLPAQFCPHAFQNQLWRREL